MKRHRWQSYLYVKAYWMLSGAFEHKQRTEMQRAAMDGAPLDAAYWSQEHGRWIPYHEAAMASSIAAKASELREEKR